MSRKLLLSMMSLGLVGCDSTRDWRIAADECRTRLSYRATRQDSMRFLDTARVVVVLSGNAWNCLTVITRDSASLRSGYIR